MNNLAIIPARGGSKRIPRKNIKDFLGQPIINYSIRAAEETGLFSEIVVSTDDEEIATVAHKAGKINVFFRRPETANDYADLNEVLEEVILARAKKGDKYDNFCCILPTAPFVTAGKLKKAYDLMQDKNYTSIFTVVKYSYPIQRALKIDGDKIKMIRPENYSKRSQDLPSSFHDAGQFYWMRVEKFLKERKVFTENSGAIVVPELEAQDIDEMEDWLLAEIKYQAWRGSRDV